MYCVQDRQLICGLCLTVGQHQGHTIDDLQVAFIREKQTPSRLLARLSERRWAQVCELGEQLEQEKTRCEDLVRQDRQEVNQFFQTLEAVLARKKQAYLQALDKASAEVARVYDPLIHKVKDLQEEQLDLVSLGSSVEEEDSPLVFLEKVHMFRERVEEFITTPLPSVINLSVIPRAAEYLQQHWPAVTLGSLEEAPVPKLCCCTRCGSVDADGGRDRSDGWAQDLWCELRPTSSVVLLGLLLLLVALWVNPIGGASLGFSLVSQLQSVSPRPEQRTDHIGLRHGGVGVHSDGGCCRKMELSPLLSRRNSRPAAGCLIQDSDVSVKETFLYRSLTSVFL
ncbi:Tripartite motif-containing protein 59 [Larimichthys crocea]|uniref:Uncharacterized protein n=1 Tax=Larimichthys crocea TaxID=215358 RepID=A0ACD3QJG4_LARCR|nr:Tripartite motif-containing protein 59 [Larimichthys crocea]